MGVEGGRMVYNIHTGMETRINEYMKRLKPPGRQAVGGHVCGHVCGPMRLSQAISWSHT